MSLLQALSLGIIQGLTEFLPVSSSGHLVIFQHLFGFSSPPVFFDIILHLASLLAVLIFFSPRLKLINLTDLKLVVIGSIPAVIAGIFLDPYLDPLFSSLWIVSLGLFITAFLLLQSRHLPPKTSSNTPKKSLIIGLFQALAITPGISRSGSTVIAAKLQGLSNSDAFFFSFFLAIPAILGAFILELHKISASDLHTTPELFIGFLAATLSSFLALKLLKLIIEHTKLYYFAYYCLFLSSLIVVYQVINNLS